MSKDLLDKIENLLKFGTLKNVKGSDSKLQEIQIKTLRNIEDSVKVSEFGFNSKAPVGSRSIVARIGNENIVIANEHLASIIDISSGNTVIYNESGHTIKIEGDTITTTATNIINNCSNYTINASSKFTVNSPVSEFSAEVNVLGLLSASSYSGLAGSSMTTNVTLNTTQDVVASGISLKDHTHSGIQIGSDNTGVPN